MRVRMPLRRVGTDERLSVVDHLSELRSRLLVACTFLVVAFGVAYAFHRDLIDVLRRPLPHRYDRLYTFAPHEAFVTTMKVCFAAALLATLPVLLYQLYAFVIPAFRDVRRRGMLLTVAGVSALFLAGVVFAYFVVLPAALRFLFSFDGGSFVQTTRASDYLSFATTLLFFTGVVFEVPAAMVAFARMGLVSGDRFARSRRGAIVAIAVLAALLPGGDPVSMILIMIPLYALYELGIRLARAFGREAPWRAAGWRAESASDGGGGAAG